MQTSYVHSRNPIRPQMLATSFRGGSSADSAKKGLFRSLRTIQLYVALAQGRRLCGTSWVTSDEGRTVTLESPLNKLGSRINNAHSHSGSCSCCDLE